MAYFCTLRRAKGGTQLTFRGTKYFSIAYARQAQAASNAIYFGV
jgi:hypothetical protein